MRATAGGWRTPFFESSSSHQGGCPILRLFSGEGWDAQQPAQLCLPTRAGPERLDLHGSFNTRQVMPEAAPRPVFRLLDQPALDRIAMHIAKFLDPLLFVMHVEIVIPPLPELNLSALLSACAMSAASTPAAQPTATNGAAPRSADERAPASEHSQQPQIHTADARLKLTLEDAARRSVIQQRLPAITTEGEKVKTSALLVTDKPLRHDRRILLPIRSVQVRAFPPFARKKRRMGHPIVYGYSRVGHPPLYLPAEDSVFAGKNGEDGHTASESASGAIEFPWIFFKKDYPGKVMNRTWHEREQNA